MNIRRNGRDTPLSFLVRFSGRRFCRCIRSLCRSGRAGLWYFFSAAGKRFQAVGWAWIFAAGVIVSVSPRVYYLFPAFPILFAAGGVFWETRAHWRRYVWPIGLAASAVVSAPFAIPVLPPETYIRYSQALHISPPPIETHKLGPLPQSFADRFGWEEMTAVVAGVYDHLPAEVRPRTAIFGQNYGEAAAIDLFGPRYGLPAAISGHQSYFYWGPRGYTGESVIVMHGDQQDLESKFAEVQKVAHVEHPYSMPFEHFDVYYCRGLKRPLREIWPTVKHWN